MGRIVTLPVIVLSAAEADLAEAKAWYESNRRGWSDKFRLRVDEVFDRIALMPELHAVILQRSSSFLDSSVPLCGVLSG